MGPSFKYITASRVGPNLNHRPNRLGKKRLKAFFRRKLYIIESLKLTPRNASEEAKDE
jgi:hypothetical protein